MRNMRNLKKQLVWLALLLLVMVGCRRPDMSLFKSDAYYYDTEGGNDVVLHFDSVKKHKVYGKCYVSKDALVAQARPFVVEVGRRGNAEITWLNDHKKTDASVETDGDVLRIEATVDGKARELEFKPLVKPEFIPYRNQYVDSCYNYKCISEVYGNARGFRTSCKIPPGGNNNYLEVIFTQAGDMLYKKDLPLIMDIYLPVTNDSVPRPLLMLIHGGAFLNGDKQDMAFVKWSKYFVSRGYVVASINYRVGFRIGKYQIARAGYRALQDANAAMRYLMHHADEYHINKDLVFVGGSSAGAITALNLAFMKEEHRPEGTKSGNMHGIFRPDLGPINSVNQALNEPFKIKAVINMWGAVHDINMIDSTSHIDILSFHGDADDVVAYGYDYPFNSVKLVNTFLLDKMYGSSCIHKRAQELGMRSILHTVKRGSHSLHEDVRGRLTDYFYFIEEEANAFLFSEMVKVPVTIANLDKGIQWFGIKDDSEVGLSSWDITGGVIIESGTDGVKVLFFEDEPHHELRVSGLYKNGIEFMVKDEL